MKVIGFYQASSLFLYFQLAIQQQCPPLNQISRDLISQNNHQYETSVYPWPVKLSAVYIFWKIGSGAKIFLQHGCSNSVPKKFTNLNWIKDKQFLIYSGSYLIGRATSISILVSCVKGFLHGLKNSITYTKSAMNEVDWKDYNLITNYNFFNSIDKQLLNELENTGSHVVNVITKETNSTVLIPVVEYDTVKLFLTEPSMIGQVLQGYLSHRQSKSSVVETMNNIWWIMYDSNCSKISKDSYYLQEQNLNIIGDYNHNWCIGM